MQLQGKTAVVTGGSRGIGAAIAALFLQEGATVFITTTTAENLDKAKSENAGLNGFVCDFGNVDSLRVLAKEIHEQGVQPDIVVNNAGIMDDALLMMSKDEMILRQISINLSSPVIFTREMVKIMARRKSGSIINLASIIGVNGNAGQSVYAATKAGIIGFTKSLAKELAPLQIRVNAIAPGYIDTDLVSHYSPEMVQKTMDKIGMKKAGTPQNVAEAALFLASDNSSYLTGQVLGVDGGMII